MTCIIALKKDDSIYWGADSCVTGYDTRTMSRPKIFKVGKMVFGGSGNLRMLQILEHHLVPPKHKKKKLSDINYLIKKVVPQIRELTKTHGQLDGAKPATGGEKSGGYFLIGYRGNIYELWFDFSITPPVECYEAIGSGQSHALGSLFSSTRHDGAYDPKYVIEDALLAAEFFNAGVRAPFLFYKQTGKELEVI